MFDNPMFDCLESMEIQISLVLLADDFLRKLAHVWWLHSAEVNCRLDGTELVVPTAELLSKFNPYNLLSGEWQMTTKEPKVWHLIPTKRRSLDRFSQNCYEIGAVFTRDAHECLMLFVPVQLEMDLPSPHFEKEYAFYLKPKCANDGQQQQGKRPNKFELHLLCHKDTHADHRRHLCDGFWPQMKRWVGQSLDVDSQHNLLEPNSYMRTYLRLKGTHGEQIVQEFWRIHGLSPERFAVYPCGKGILVHLLVQEGFPGFGLNSGESKLWQQFRSQGTELRVADFERRHISAGLPPQLVGVDFLIGQLDALPWIPLLAARLRCNFFLILTTHCHHDFYTLFNKNERGAKMGDSREELYIKYLCGICTKLGFHVQTDQLRISSKNRTFIIGTIPQEGLLFPSHADEMLEMNPDEMLEEQIAEILAKAPKQVKQSVPITTFSSAAEEKDQLNKLSKNIIYSLIGLEATAMIGNWRCGKTAVLLKQLANELDENDRKTLANCDGGILGFLRAQKQLFDVQRKGVSIRRWSEVFGKFYKKDGGKQQSECLFEKLHPDGCPLDNKQCPYKHTGTD